VDVVFHAAAKVGDWGTWREFQSSGVEATRLLATAAVEAGVGRFVHISSTSAYGHPAERGAVIDESARLGQNIWPWDPYTWSKVESERILWELARRRGLAVTVLRPSWLYGERDRTTVARLVDRLRSGRARLIGPGNNPLSAVYAGHVADAAILSARDPGSAGQAYNVASQGRITQREFLNLVAEACGAAAVARQVPYRVAFAAASLIEAQARLTRRARPPSITRYAIWLLGRDLQYSSAKARARLRWTPALSYRESIDRAVRWYLAQTGRRPTGGNEGNEGRI
jgi:nucleoside-diphosphate-sugar epimerase